MVLVHLGVGDPSKGQLEGMQKWAAEWEKGCRLAYTLEQAAAHTASHKVVPLVEEEDHTGEEGEDHTGEEEG